MLGVNSDGIESSTRQEISGYSDVIKYNSHFTGFSTCIHHLLLYCWLLEWPQFWVNAVVGDDLLNRGYLYLSELCIC